MVMLNTFTKLYILQTFDKRCQIAKSNENRSTLVFTFWFLMKLIKMLI